MVAMVGVSQSAACTLVVTNNVINVFSHGIHKNVAIDVYSELKTMQLVVISVVLKLVSTVFSSNTLPCFSAGLAMSPCACMSVSSLLFSLINVPMCLHIASAQKSAWAMLPGVNRPLSGRISSLLQIMSKANAGVVVFLSMVGITANTFSNSASLKRTCTLLLRSLVRKFQLSV